MGPFDTQETIPGIRFNEGIPRVGPPSARRGMASARPTQNALYRFELTFERPHRHFLAIWPGSQKEPIPKLLRHGSLSWSRDLLSGRQISPLQNTCSAMRKECLRDLAQTFRKSSMLLGRELAASGRPTRGPLALKVCNRTTPRAHAERIRTHPIQSLTQQSHQWPASRQQLKGHAPVQLPRCCRGRGSTRADRAIDTDGPASGRVPCVDATH
jgi:hypothetical protein